MMENRRWTEDDLAILRLMRTYGLPRLCFSITRGPKAFPGAAGGALGSNQIRYAGA